MKLSHYTCHLSLYFYIICTYPYILEQHLQEFRLRILAEGAVQKMGAQQSNLLDRYQEVQEAGFGGFQTSKDNWDQLIQLKNIMIYTYTQLGPSQGCKWFWQLIRNYKKLMVFAQKMDVKKLMA